MWTPTHCGTNFSCPSLKAQAKFSFYFFPFWFQARRHWPEIKTVLFLTTRFTTCIVLESLQVFFPFLGFGPFYSIWKTVYGFCREVSLPFTRWKVFLWLLEYEFLESWDCVLIISITSVPSPSLLHSLS